MFRAAHFSGLLFFRAKCKWGAGMAYQENEPFNLRELLGAKESYALQKLTIYLPDKDRNQRPIRNIEDYIEGSMRLLVEMNRGVTRLPIASGIWRNDEDEDIEENTTIIYSYITDPETFLNKIPKLKSLLYNFGEETNQGEVFVEFSGEAVDGSTFYYRMYSISFERSENA